MGSDLVSFLCKHENQRVLRPDFQSELRFGIHNSGDQNQQGFKDILNAFFEQDELWHGAEQAIISDRDKSCQGSDPTTERFRSAVGSEVDYVYALWNKDYDSALAKAKSVADSLGGDDTKGYRGWWYYLTADAALLLHEATDDEHYLHTAKDKFKRASRCCLSISWLAELSRLRSEDLRTDDDGEVDVVTARAVEAIWLQLSELGIEGRKFEEHISELFKEIDSDEHADFHRGLEKLGRLLGFSASAKDEPSAPDCVWYLDATHCFAHEAKTEKRPEGPIGTNDLRQAAGHANWVRERYTLDSEVDVPCLIETHQQTVDQSALPQANGIFHVDPEDLRSMAREISVALRAVRTIASGIGEEAILEKLSEELRARKLKPADVLERLTNQTVDELPVA
jgi:hypothetical protein